VALTDAVAYVATYNGYPATPFPLYAINRNSNAILWTSRVWAQDGFMPLGGLGGFVPGRMELKISQDALIAFGAAASDEAYIERFDLKTGNNLSRFCPDYYGYDK
jgi:hypothetical protein